MNHIFFPFVYMWKVLVIPLHLTLWDPMDCSPPGSSVHGILQARMLEWVAFLFSKRSFWSRDWTHVSHTVGRFFTIWVTRRIFIQFFEHLLMKDVLSPVNWVCNFSKTSCPYMCMSIFRFSILFPLSTFANIKMVSISMLLLLLLSRFSHVWLCNPIDGSPPGSPIPGILRARILEWVAISFSSA